MKVRILIILTAGLAAGQLKQATGERKKPVTKTHTKPLTVPPQAGTWYNPVRF